MRAPGRIGVGSGYKGGFGKGIGGRGSALGGGYKGGFGGRGGMTPSYWQHFHRMLD